MKEHRNALRRGNAPNIDGRGIRSSVAAKGGLYVFGLAGRERGICRGLLYSEPQCNADRRVRKANGWRRQNARQRRRARNGYDVRIYHFGRADILLPAERIANLSHFDNRKRQFSLERLPHTGKCVGACGAERKPGRFPCGRHILCGNGSGIFRHRYEYTDHPFAELTKG